MTDLALLILMFVVGAVSVAQPAINASLAQKVGVMSSSIVSFAGGALFLLIISMGIGQIQGFRGMVNATWWELTGGVLGAVFVTAMIVAVPRIGTTAVIAAAIAGQLVGGLFLDSIGAFGLKQIALDPKRIAGVALLLIGSGLIFRR